MSRLGKLVKGLTWVGAAALLAPALRAADRTANWTGVAAEDQETSGVLTKLDAATLELDATTVFQITADTRFVGDPKVADQVDVKFHLDPQGHAIADLVVKEDAADVEPEVDFTGTVEKIGASQWTISGRAVLVNADTVIEGSPQVGDTVEVHAKDLTEGLVATRIKAEEKQQQNPPPEKQRVEFQGVVESVGATWIISGQAVVVNAATRIDGTPKKGDTVKVEATKMTDGTLVALEIDKENEDGDDSGGHSDGRD